VGALALLVLPAVALAQPIPQDQQQSPRARLRDRYNRPQNAAKLDDALRKFNSEDADTRLEGVRALGAVEGDKKAIDYLVQAANDPDSRIRLKAIDTIGNLRAKEATPILVQQLFLRDTDAKTKQRILVSLGKIGDSRATGPLIDFVQRDVDPALRGNAIYALGDIGDQTALAPLEKIATNGDEEILRPIAADAARRIRERPAPPVIPPSLRDRRAVPEEQTP
jgi:HEAT repeat protein